MTNTLKGILLTDNPVAELKKLHAQGLLGDLEPTLSALKMDIPTGYHHKDNLEHSFQVLQNAIDREKGTPDLILRTAALFHDIGKPDTREFGNKGVVTFTNHEAAGVKIVRRVLPAHGYTKNDIALIARLIALHMRSHTFKEGWSESAVRRLGTDVGSPEQLDRLIIIFYSDATTKFDTKKSAIHGSVKELADEIARVKAKDARATLRPALDGKEVATLLGIAPGPELGKVMRLLNADENVGLTREQTIELLTKTYLEV